MKKYTAHIVFSISLILTAAFCLAQGISVRASIDQDRILIGEPIHLQLEADLPEGANGNWFLLDTIPHFEFIEKGKVDSSKAGTYKQAITITSFDSGRWIIPSFSLDVNGRSYLTDSLPVTVAFSEFDPNKDYHDIKDILEVPPAAFYYLKWILLGLGILLSILLVWYLLKRYRKKSTPGGEVVGRLSAYEEAVQSLNALKKQQLPVKQLYVQLNDILRWYVYRRTRITTMQKTNEEFILQLEKLPLPQEDFIRLAQTLRMADAVKFAKFIPGDQDNEKSFEVIRKAIDQLNNTANRAV